MFRLNDETILNCTHDVMQPVRRLIGGRLNVYMQCPVCGQGGGARRKCDYDVDMLPWWDETIIAEREAARERRAEQARIEWDAKYAAAEAERNAAEERWKHWYHEVYLNSEEWKHVRQRALRRDNYTCQNCFQKVTDYTARVHHIRPWGYTTIRATGHSLTFELVTLCVRCHAMAHPEKQP